MFNKDHVCEDPYRLRSNHESVFNINVFISEVNMTVLFSHDLEAFTSKYWKNNFDSTTFNVLNLFVQKSGEFMFASADI